MSCESASKSSMAAQRLMFSLIAAPVWVEVPADTAGDPRGGVLDGISGQVRVSGSGLNLGMA